MMRFDHSLPLSQGAPMSQLRNLCSDRWLRVPLPINRFRVVALAFSLASVLIAVGCAETSDEVFVRATNGEAEAQIALGDQFVEPGEARDLTAAADWYERAATQGNQLAQFKLGQLHFGESDGAFEPKPATGVRWLSDAAEMGNEEAMRDLIAIHDEGRGIPKDPEISGKWMVKVAEFEKPADLVALGIRYYEANGVPLNRGRGAKLIARAAELGDATAQLYLARIYTTQGNGVVGNLEIAVGWFTEAAEQGDLESQNYLGMLYASGQGVEKDYEASLLWLRRAADKGYANAQANLAVMYSEGHGVEKDPVEAERWFRAAAANEPLAQLELGKRYARGSIVSEDQAEAMLWYLKAAENDVAEAQLIVARAFDQGDGVETDLAQAARWYAAAAKNGVIEAQLRGAELFETGAGGVDKDIKQTAGLYRLAAEAGDLDAMWKYGQMLEIGRGAPMNRSGAVEWYRKATVGGHSQARTHLALILDQGRFVRRNAESAAALYEEEAAAGNVSAMARLGELYWEGDGIPRDRKRALEWHVRAADQGNITSASFAGVRYFEGGYGIVKKPDLAFRYLSMAEKAGDIVGSYYVGQCLWKGIGVEQNRAKSIPYFKLAADKGVPGSFRYLGIAAVVGMTKSENQVSEAYSYFAIGDSLRDPGASSELQALRKKLNKPDVEKFNANALKEYERYEAIWAKNRNRRS
jgi:TPR repeat protein